MTKFSCTLICVLLLVSIFGPTIAGRFGGGGGRHSYPSSRGGLSGSRSGYGTHSHPSSSGSHSYPSSGGMSGTGSRTQSHGYPSPGSGLSGGGGGSHTYPSSGGRLSGSGATSNTGYNYNKNPGSSNTYTSHTTVHHHYNYSPPQQIRYVGASGPTTYPVYHGTPPTYVYQYKNSGSKYGTLLTGLALLNLGALAGVAGGLYANRAHTPYKSQPDERCLFGLRKPNGDYEETKIDCQIITSFIFQSQDTTQSQPTNSSTVVTSTTVTNITTVNATNPVGAEVMLPNGTLVMTNATAPAVNSTTIISTTTTNTSTNALDVKGEPIKVNPAMKCYVIRTTNTSRMQKTVDCGLLQTYADQSLRRNSATKNIPTFTILTAIIAAFVIY